VTDGETTFLAAVNAALAAAMRADQRVIVLGEDVAEGGPYGATAGLADEFGRARVLNTPISEGAVCGAAIGAEASCKDGQEAAVHRYVVRAVQQF
jgi:pyruvate dehydrogenase E1 component beta subunit